MCGIAGQLSLDPQEPLQESDIRPMCDVIVHRGPDDEGFMVDGPLAMGMRRLAPPSKIFGAETWIPPLLNRITARVRPGKVAGNSPFSTSDPGRQTGAHRELSPRPGRMRCGPQQSPC